MRRKGWCKCHLSKQQARRGSVTLAQKGHSLRMRLAVGVEWGCTVVGLRGVGCSENVGVVVAEVVFTKQWPGCHKLCRRHP